MNMLTARWLAWFSVGLYFFLATVGLALQFVTDRPVEPLPGGFAVLAYFGVGLGLWAVIGALIVSRHPRHPKGWLLCAMAIDSGMQNFSFGYAAYGLVAHPGSLPGALALVYHGSVTLLQRMFAAVSGQQSAVTTVISTLGIAALFTPSAAVRKNSSTVVSTAASTTPHARWLNSPPRRGTRWSW